tara:strand:- start:9775 stop:10983 length:1209 start_codon:yes stop_codon:yes gene_type:complete
MADLLGFTSIALISILTFFVAFKWPDISRILYAALIVRVIVMLLGHYVITLPDSTYDARGFEHGAWNYAKDGFINLYYNYPGANSAFYRWMIAIPYSLFGRSLLMAQSFSLLIGLGCVFLGWLLTKKIWNKDIASRAGWILALFPSLILYSVLTLREIYVCFFLIVAMFGVVNWARDNSYKSIALAMFGFISGTLFHGGIIIGAMIFTLFVLIRSIKKIFKLSLSYRTSLKSLLIIISTLIILQLYFSNKIHIAKLGTFKDSIDIKRLQFETKNRLRGEASYPEWTKVEKPSEFFTKGFVRVLYLLFSPFPWDVKKMGHLIGMLDGLLYIGLVYLIILNRKIIWQDPALRLILIILGCYLFIFGIGVSNFGAGTRHRAKFVIELIILAAPLIPKFTFFKKKN